MHPQPKPPRSPGAQPGNTNALKHGFYSRQLKRLDHLDLESCRFAGLNDEITVLRVYLRRLIELGKDLHSFPEMLSLVRVMCLASTSLTRLLKTQNLVVSPSDERARLRDQAIAEVLSELQAECGLGNDPPPSPPGPGSLP